MRILLVEDYKDMGELIWKLLDGEGHEVTYVTTGRAAVNMLDNESFDLVVTDWELEYNGPNGADILEHAQTISPDTVVCIFSSLDRTWDLNRLGMTADKVLIKSDFEGLIDFVNSPNM